MNQDFTPLTKIIDEGRHIATIEYTVSQEKPGTPDLSSLVIHTSLSIQDVPRFTVMFRDVHIEDKRQSVCISVPCELLPVMMEIYEFTSCRTQRYPGSEDLGARLDWLQVQEVSANSYLYIQVMAQITISSRNTANACRRPLEN